MFPFLRMRSKALLMKSLYLVMLGGGVGAGMRHLLSLRLAPLAASTGWPWGTFAANIGGGLAMGLLSAWLIQSGQGGFGLNVRLLLGAGLLGGFTTFSAFSLEMAMMIERGAIATAFAYAVLSVTIALAAVFAGIFAGKAVFA